MNNINIIEAIKKYAHEQNIKYFVLYSDHPGFSENVTIIRHKEISRALIGPTLINEKPLIESLIPQIVLDSPEQFKFLMLRYTDFLVRNPQVTEQFFNNNRTLLEGNQGIHKELCIISSSLFKNNCSLVTDIFKSMMNENYTIITKRKSLTYHIDFYPIMEQTRYKSFHSIKNSILNSLSNINKEIEKKLKIGGLLIKDDDTSGLDICIIEPKNQILIDTFMDKFIGEVMRTPLIKTDEINAMIDYIVLDNSLKKKSSSNKRKI